MGDNSRIEWTDATWNPVWGCTEVSEGCDHCYARTLAERFGGPDGFALRLVPDKLDQPLRWRKPRRIFTNSMSDLFHKDVPSEYIARVFAVMALAPQHTFQVLTKRPGRMRSMLRSQAFTDWVDAFVREEYSDRWAPNGYEYRWPLPNVWLGTSVENQKWADVRIPLLMETPAVVRFLSCEPLLGEVYLSNDLLWVPRPCPSGCGCTLPTHPDQHDCACDGPCCMDPDWDRKPDIDWVIVGGESGPHARPMHPDWTRSLRDQCTDAGIAFHFKQWGGPRPKSNGREIDGRTWDEYPIRGES
jgi:protein gp37